MHFKCIYKETDEVTDAWITSEGQLIPESCVKYIDAETKKEAWLKFEEWRKRIWYSVDLISIEEVK